MRTYFHLLTICIFGAFGVHAQNVKMVFDQHYIEEDRSFDGQHLAFYNFNDEPYTIDKNGLITGKWVTYHDNGAYESMGTMFKGEKNGLWRSFDSEGHLISEAHFTHGAKDGNWKVWDANGTLRYDMHYKNGNRVHVWTVYDAAGNLTEERQY